MRKGLKKLIQILAQGKREVLEKIVSVPGYLASARRSYKCSTYRFTIGSSEAFITVEDVRRYSLTMGFSSELKT